METKIDLDNDTSVLTVVATEPPEPGQESHLDLTGTLKRLVKDTNNGIARALVERFDNESLARAEVHWSELECVRAVRWFDDKDENGWLVELVGAYPDAVNVQLVGWLQTFLRNRGWGTVVVEFRHT